MLGTSLIGAAIMNWVPEYGELSYHSADIFTFMSTEAPWDSVMSNYGQHVQVARVQQPGYINDPDFIIADEPYLDLEEKKSHLAMAFARGHPNPECPHGGGLEFIKNKDLIDIN